MNRTVMAWSAFCLGLVFSGCKSACDEAYDRLLAAIDNHTHFTPDQRKAAVEEWKSEQRKKAFIDECKASSEVGECLAGASMTLPSWLA